MAGQRFQFALIYSQQFHLLRFLKEDLWIMQKTEYYSNIETNFPEKNLSLQVILCIKNTVVVMVISRRKFASRLETIFLETPVE